MLVWVAVDAITITWKRRRLLAAPRIPSLRIMTTMQIGSTCKFVHTLGAFP